MMTDATMTDATTLSPEPATATALPTCACGNDRHHYRVSRDGEYTTWGWILLMCGISVKALKINFRCRACDQVFDTSVDPRDLRRRS